MSRGIFTVVASATVTAAKRAADNARAMVLSDRPKLRSLEEVAATFATVTAAAELAHAALGGRIDAVINDVRARFASLPAPIAQPASVTQVEYRDGVPIPALALGGAKELDPIVWPSPFPDANYLVTVQVTGGLTLLGKVLVTVKTKTPTSVVLTVNTAALLTAGAATVSAVAYRKS